MFLHLSRKKQLLFAAAAAGFSLFFALFMAELLLNFQRSRIQKSSHFDPGMVLYDEILGWKMAPGWQGGHRHYDFQVTYSTNPYGFRGVFNPPGIAAGKRYAFVGDSFTFSYGVNDHETFIYQLGAWDKKTAAYMNFGVPGYSTDQEYLLIKQRVFFFLPDVIFLVVYLGNDLFDNALPFPLQAQHAKPYFELTSEGLVLRNTPVPRETKPASQAQKDLQHAVFGDRALNRGLPDRYLGRFQLYQVLRQRFGARPDSSGYFTAQFKNSLGLFFAIIEQTRRECVQKNTRLALVLMPGKSFVELPGSLSAQFQDYLRQKIVENRDKMKVEVLDLAGHLRSRYGKTPGRWFYPNEGHLTSQGHRVVAEFLRPQISR
ncbi:MAG: SGNH/GDSL hydrolase family protein [Desulfobacterales bacterium]|nr:SGNH/GDSL hydrolase family protein [Desulfobacterales bacterium]